MLIIQISTLGIEDDIREAIEGTLPDDVMQRLDSYGVSDGVVQAVKKAVLDREVLCNCDMDKSMQRVIG
jgi:hypothetical protein